MVTFNGIGWQEIELLSLLLHQGIVAIADAVGQRIQMRVRFDFEYTLIYLGRVSRRSERFGFHIKRVVEHLLLVRIKALIHVFVMRSRLLLFCISAT